MRHSPTLLSALGLVFSQLGCGSSAADRTASFPAREGYVAVRGGVELFYRVLGSGGDTMVVLHGGPGFSMDYFVEDLAPLAERNTLIFYDQRGSGGSTLVSDPVALDAQRFAEDLEALRTHFRLEQLTLLAHSWGAGVAAVYDATYPGRTGRLIVVGGIPLRRDRLLHTFQQLDASRDSSTRREMEQWQQARLADPGDASACRAYYALWFGPFYGDASAAERSRGDFCAGTPESLANKVNAVDRHTLASLGDWDWRPSLSTLAAPTLVIHGTSDVIPLEDARDWAAAVPEGRLLVLRGIGHFPYVEAPERFFAAVEVFLDGGWPEGAEPVAGS